jgi:hypothetical protein
MTLAALRGYAIALIMHKGHLKEHELVSTVVGQCCLDDLKVGGIDLFDGQEYDGTRLEKLIDQLTAELESNGLLVYSEPLVAWVPNSAKLGAFVKWSAALNCDLPDSIKVYVRDALHECHAEA